MTTTSPPNLENVQNNKLRSRYSSNDTNSPANDSFHDTGVKIKTGKEKVHITGKKDESWSNAQHIVQANFDDHTIRLKDDEVNANTHIDHGTTNYTTSVTFKFYLDKGCNWVNVFDKHKIVFVEIQILNPA